MVVFRFGNDNYRYRNRLSTFSAIIVPKLFEFGYPTLANNNTILYDHTTTGTIAKN